MLSKVIRFVRLQELWPLYLILELQAALTIPRIADMPSGGDEALYRWEGYIEWQHWLQGTALPRFNGFTSGAPQIYPPLSALTGSLLGARLLSLAFMLGITILLWLTAQKLFNRTVAIASSALFVAIGPTTWIGTLATFDAMAFFLLALTAYLATFKGWKFLVGCVVALALANLTKYASILWDPVIVCIALIRFGWRQASVLALGTALLVWLSLNGLGDISGLVHTTTARPHGDNPPMTVLGTAFSWIGVVIVVALVGAILAWASSETRELKWLLTLFFAATLLAPLDEARINTLQSLDKHAGYGAWFGCIAAGYAVGRIVIWAQGHVSQPSMPELAAAALVLPVLLLGVFQFNQAVPRPPWSGKVISVLQEFAPKAGSGYILTDQPEPQHLVPPIAPPPDWKIARIFTVGRGNNQSAIIHHYIRLIAEKQVKLIVLGFSGKFKLQDDLYLKALEGAHAYRQIHHGTNQVKIWVRR